MIPNLQLRKFPKNSACFKRVCMRISFYSVVQRSDMMSNVCVQVWSQYMEIT